MFIVLAYDVGEKRVSKVLKTTKKYLTPIQRSLFQGFITESELKRLKSELEALIDKTDDSVVIYKLHDINSIVFEEIGVSKFQGNHIL